MFVYNLVGIVLLKPKLNQTLIFFSKTIHSAHR